MPAIRVTITLPYYLRLAEGDYAGPGGAETVRVLALLIAPFMPSTSQKILLQLGMSPAKLHFAMDTRWGLLPSKQMIGPLAPLFPKLALRAP